MKYAIQFLDIQRQGAKDWFSFRVSNGLSNQTVAVSMAIEFNDTLEPLGSTKLSREELIQLAKDWLAHCVNKEPFDPFNCSDVPRLVFDYWIEHRSIPS